MTASLHWLEWLPLASYALLLWWVGFRSRSQNPSREEFLLAGRSLSLPGFVATLVTTWYGGILGIGEFSYLYGLSTWVVFGLPYYIFAILFAFLLAPRIRAAALISIPDLIYNHYGRSAGYWGTFFVFFMTLPAAYILMVGLLIHWLSGWSLLTCLLLGGIVSTAYVLAGGFRSVVATDKLQFLLMYGGFALLLTYLLIQYGGVSWLRAHLPAQHLSWKGGNSWTYIVSWYFIALWTFVDPGFHQRCSAARTPRIARNGILISVGFWFLFDTMTILSGLYARALFADIPPALSYPLLGHTHLPPLASGVFLTALLATIMSTVDSLTLLSAITLGHDLFARFPRWQRANESQLVRIGLFISLGLSILLAALVPSVIQIWYLIGNLFIPPLLLPLLSCYFPAWRISARWTQLNFGLAFALSLLSLLIGISRSGDLSNPDYLWGIPPLYPGMGLSLLLYGMGNFLKAKRAKYGR